MIRELTMREMEYVYHKYMEHDFPGNELKPLSVIKKQLERQTEWCLGYYEQDELIGYAIMNHCDKNRCLLLDYFAIIPQARTKGKGTSFLKELAQYYRKWNAIFIESETEISETAIKRLAFYKRAGAVRTPLKINLYHTDYYILMIALGKKLQGQEIKTAIQEIYEMIYTRLFRWKYLKFYRSEQAD